MSHEEAITNLEAYVLGALDEDEARLTQRHISECAECTDLAAAYERAVNLLAFTAPLYHASPRLKDRIMSGIGALRPVPSIPGFLTKRWVFATAAAVLLAVGIGGATWAAMLSSEVNRLKADNARLVELTELSAEDRTALLRLQGQLSSAQSEQRNMSRTLEEQAKLIVLALDTALIPTELQGTNLAPTARCNYVWSSAQAVGALTCKDLPSTAFGLNYEFWATRGDKTVPLGAFTPRADGTASMLIKFPSDTEGPIANLWITLETQGSPRSRPSSQVVAERVPAQQAVR